MPAHRKPLEQRADNRPSRARFELVPGERIAMPAPPEGLLAETLRAWEAYWSSELARFAYPPSDLPDLERLFELRDERTRIFRAVRKERVVLGSQKQPVPNGLFATLASLDAAIDKLSDRFGMNPSARARLSIDFSKARRTLEDVNRDLGDPDDTEDDPDLAAVQLAPGGDA